MTRSTLNMTKSTSDLTKSTLDLTRSTLDLTRSTLNLTRSTLNMTESTSDLTRFTSDLDKIKIWEFDLTRSNKINFFFAGWENFFLKTQEMVDNLLKIEYFYLKTLLCIHYLCTNISAKF